MTDLLGPYWMVIVIALAIVLLSVVLVALFRKKPVVPTSPPAERKPLEPRKPDIIPAKANRFDAPPQPVSPATADPSPVPPSPEAPIPAATAVPPTGDGDDLTMMKGVGPKLVAKLSVLGVSSFTQIAAWSDADIDRIDSELGAFAGRIRRDDWPSQARLLAAGDRVGFEKAFGAIG